MPKETLHYTNNEVTIVWKPKTCIHSTICWKGLIQVFNPRERPWVKIDAASTERIVEQVGKCPSGALSYFANEEAADKKMIQEETSERVRLMLNLLPQEQREIIVLRHYADLSFREIAEVSNCSINTCLGRMRYGLINMRRLLTEKQIAL